MAGTYGFTKTKNKVTGVESITLTDPSGQPMTITSENAQFPKVMEALRASKYEEAFELVTLATTIKKFSEGNFLVVNGQIEVNGRKVPNELAEMIMDFQQEGLDYKPLVAFANKLFLNPSHRSVMQLFAFLDKNRQAVTTDGDFIAYKRVRSDFKDIHSGTFDNTPGTVVQMERNMVDDEPTRTCSNGLHVANWDYACNQFGGGEGVMLAVKVNPADVVSVPIDYNQSKMRVCKYEVLEVVEVAHSARLVSNTGSTISSDFEDEDEDEEEETEESDECDDCGADLNPDGSCSEGC